MTMPPKDIIVKCPECEFVYKDWWRPSINLMLDDFDDEYIKNATTSTCPDCGFCVQHDVLIVGEDGTFYACED